MALREFDDTDGKRWHVWETMPVRGGGFGDFARGWLTFDCGSERRRLTPVPEGWAEAPDTRLALLLRAAVAVSPRDPVVGEERRVGERRGEDRRMGDRRRPLNDQGGA